ncbi:MAG TPA: hypothetical protein VMD77_14835 [Candidatus Baltobacteraceae bacterium]|nr:hypothetical protein [Candidatus Baltobacteraceae bacterium]
MSVSGILSSVMSNVLSSQTQNTQSKWQQFQQEFQELGQDLQSGNLSAAQSDFSTLQQNGPQSIVNSNSSANSSSSTQSNNPLAAAFNQLSQDLQSGNLAGAQSDYSTIQQDMQSHGAHMHHHGGGAGSGISQEFQELGQALQSGNLSNAQQAYTTLQQDFEQFSTGGASGTQGTSANPSPSISINI